MMEAMGVADSSGAAAMMLGAAADRSTLARVASATGLDTRAVPQRRAQCETESMSALARVIYMLHKRNESTPHEEISMHAQQRKRLREVRCSRACRACTYTQLLAQLQLYEQQL